ncbi:MAG: hypothetical protein ACFFCQ_09210 [Promethearchaeota archaeon]
MNIKLKAGRFLIPVQMETTEEYIFLRFKYNKKLLDEVRCMESAHWCGYDDPPSKVWRVANSRHNRFQLEYLQGGNPYTHYDQEIIEHNYTRPLYQHQKEAADFLLSRKRAILASEMGCGKTLAAIEVMERSGSFDWWYVAPRSALKAVEREFMIWDFKLTPKLFTYEGLTKHIKNWPGGDAPFGVVFDESSRAKNPTAQRSQASYILANGVRDDNDGFVILMSGSPAPKSPADWYNQCRIACPGYLKEGNYHKFRQRLALIKQVESPYGQAYPHVVTWFDNEKKCKICGELKENHGLDDHTFESSRNEVELLSKRMKGLVLTQFKKDCLELPDKIYRTIELEPTREILDIASAVLASANTVVAGLTLLRELSDGFQYIEKVVDEETCPVCSGTKQILNPLYQADIPESSLNEEVDLENQQKYTICDGCGGKGTRKVTQRITEQVETPKESALRDLLDEYSEVGRLVIYAGFTGSVDRCVAICEANKWEWIRVDGRGWHSSLLGDHLTNFQDKLQEHPRIAFIGQPSAAGMGLTLTASPAIIYYSNDFNAESRIQSEDRIHRPGMDINRGATIIDLLHLPTDYLVLENLRKKRQLQSISMGEVIGQLRNEIHTSA